MDLFTLWIKGVGLGFAIAAPVGPIGLLCIRRTLAGGRVQGLLSGLGAASADLIYASLAGFGMQWAVQTLIGQQFWIRLGGGALLFALGVQIWLSPLPGEARQAGRSSGLGAYSSTFLLTLSNPATILLFIAVFSGLKLGILAVKPAATLLLVGGVFCGSALWWLALTSLIGLLRPRIQPCAMLWVNRISGALLALLGLIYLVSSFG
jgi:threonine/homoserine/homoserine lactone efflux protein